MNFDTLAYFEVLAQERSFTRAAQRLHITQQSLSSAIAKMERELGCQLVVRHVPLEVTYAGEVLLRYAASFRNGYAAMQQEFCDISNDQAGVLRVGVTYTRGRSILPGVIQAFQKRFPAIRVDLVEDLNDALRIKLVDGEVDLAIANFPDNTPGIRTREFFIDETVMLVSRRLFADLYGDEAADRERRLEEGDWTALEGCPLVLNSIDDISGHIERGLLKRAGMANPRVVATSSNTETLLALCALDVGACFCSERLAHTALTDAQLDSLMLLRLGESARFRLTFGYQDRSYQWSILEAFMDTALEVIGV